MVRASRLHIVVRVSRLHIVVRVSRPHHKRTTSRPLSERDETDVQHGDAERRHDDACAQNRPLASH